MEQITLNAQVRDIEGKKVRFLRDKGQLPAVLYGKNFKPLSIIIDQKIFQKTAKDAGESTLINIDIPETEKCKALIRDIQKDPVSDKIIHVDFYKVDMSSEIETEIPLSFVGVSPAVEELEGNFITNKDTIKVKCLPDKLVSEIEVDISILKTFEDLIHISDLKVPEGIKVLDDAEEIITQVTPPLSEEELKAMEEEAAADTEKAQIDTIEAEKEAEKAEGEKENAEGEGETAAESEKAPEEKKDKKGNE